MSLESQGPRRWLIADDSEEVTTSLAGLLERIPGVEVVQQVHDGAEALKQIRALQPDALILDLKMPVLSGMDVLRQLRQEALRPLVLVFTSHSESDYGRACKELGAQFFVAKPDFDQVLQIAQQLQSGSVPSAHLVSPQPSLNRPARF
jgi:DNA-binding NarL/FixJ family response regulator